MSGEAQERLREQLRAISSVLRAVARSEGLQPVLDEVVAATTRLCAGNTGTLYVLEGEFLHALSRSGELETWEFDKNNPHRIDRTTVVGRAALMRAPAHIPDVLEDPEYTYGGPRIGYRARVERQRTELARFVSPQIAELLSSDNGERVLAGHRAYITVFFCDLRGFTAFAETAAPERFGELAALWRKRGTELGLGIGIAAGCATLGRIGFEGRYDYGAFGPVTNLASRLSTEAKSRQILISQRVYAAVEDAVRAQPVGELELKGFGRPVPAYEVRALQT